MVAASTYPGGVFPASTRVIPIDHQIPPSGVSQGIVDISCQKNNVIGKLSYGDRFNAYFA
jgi:hypothetical protein